MDAVHMDSVNKNRMFGPVNFRESWKWLVFPFLGWGFYHTSGLGGHHC